MKDRQRNMIQTEAGYSEGDKKMCRREKEEMWEIQNTSYQN